MASTKARRVALWAGAVIAVLLLAVVGSGFFVAHEMKARVLETLGPLGSVGGYRCRVCAYHAEPRASAGPAGLAPVRAERVTVNVDMRALLSHRVHLQHVTVDGFYLSSPMAASSCYRISARRRARAQAGSSEAAAHTQKDQLIDHVTFERGVMEFFDESVQTPSYKRS